MCTLLLFLLLLAARGVRGQCTNGCNYAGDRDCDDVEGTTCTIFMGRFGACLPPR